MVLNFTLNHLIHQTLLFRDRIKALK